jgi:hypothetical protein
MMSDDLSNKIQQIIQMLGQDEAPNKLKEVVSMLASSLGSSEGSSDDATPTEKEKIDAPEISDKPENSELIDAAKRAMERINSNNDPRVNLLQAIKPFMSYTRQKKISNCIQMLQIASLRNLITDHENEVR